MLCIEKGPHENSEHIEIVFTYRGRVFDIFTNEKKIN